MHLTVAQVVAGSNPVARLSNSIFIYLEERGPPILVARILN